MIAKVASIALTGFEGTFVEVESDAKQGLPGIHIVGMGNKAVDEARERVRSAIAHSSLPFPARKLIINLAPAELPKDGAHFDLPIALSILVACGILKQTEVDGALFAGELSLDGSLKLIRGAITIAEAAKVLRIKTVYLPLENLTQARLVKDVEVIGVPNLLALYRHLKAISPLRNPPLTPLSQAPEPQVTVDDISGHHIPKRALAIAAAGRHNLLMSGPPGVGKSLLAKTLQGLLPPLSDDEKVNVTKLYSLAGLTDAVINERPFRSPHHSSSKLSLLGGTSKPRPGEVSLAHRGILFLDELPEFSREALEALRQPLEDRQITLTRALGTATYPADFCLVATMNPCPCGYLGDLKQVCRCSQQQIQSYQKRLSGPLLDRIDLIINVQRDEEGVLKNVNNTLKNNQQLKVLEQINCALKLQEMRYSSRSIYNASVSTKLLLRSANLSPESSALLDQATARLGLSNRAQLKALRVARTIADLAGSQTIEQAHVAEALQFRERLPT